MPGAYPPVTGYMIGLHDEYERRKKEFYTQTTEQIQHYLDNRGYWKKIKGVLPMAYEHAKKIAAKEVLEDKLREVSKPANCN